MNSPFTPSGPLSSMIWATTFRFPNGKVTQSPTLKRPAFLLLRCITAPLPRSDPRNPVQISPHCLVKDAGQTPAGRPPPPHLSRAEVCHSRQTRRSKVIVGNCIPPFVQQIQVILPGDGRWHGG